MSYSALRHVARLYDVGFSTQLISNPASWREISLTPLHQNALARAGVDVLCFASSSGLARPDYRAPCMAPLVKLLLASELCCQHHIAPVARSKHLGYFPPLSLFSLHSRRLARRLQMFSFNPLKRAELTPLVTVLVLYS